MKIGIIGAGNVGVGIGSHLTAKGHDVVISFARDDEKVRSAAARIGGGAHAGTPREAAAHGAVVIVATPWSVTLDVVTSVAGALDGKVVWDTTNPLKADMSGLEIGTTTSAGEQVAAAAPGARVVKAVPPMAEILQSPSSEIDGREPGVFVCGDDANARAIVLSLLADINADGVDAGPLANARYTEPLGMLLVQLAYVQKMGTRIGVTLLRDAASSGGS